VWSSAVSVYVLLVAVALGTAAVDQTLIAGAATPHGEADHRVEDEEEEEPEPEGEGDEGAEADLTG
jgi:hypothetical protein